MLRFHFSAEDLGRVRFMPGPDPLWEVLLSLHKLVDGQGGFVFDQWRRRVRSRLPPAAAWLSDLAPPHGYSADFLTPSTGVSDLEVGLDAVLSTPRHRLRRDIALLAPRTVDTRTAGLADGNAAALRELGAVLRAYHQVAIAPFWKQICACVQADIATRCRALLHAGVEHMLSELHPLAEWEPPVLSLPYEGDQDLKLEGRGLLLVPSFFCWTTATTLKDPMLPPVLVYPIEHDLDWLDPARPRQPLATLLGRSRAAVLRRVADGACNTTDLADHAGISTASASQHATVLRNAGLITSRRRGNNMIHVLAPVGAALLGGNRQEGGVLPHHLSGIPPEIPPGPRR